MNLNHLLRLLVEKEKRIVTGRTRLNDPGVELLGLGDTGFAV